MAKESPGRTRRAIVNRLKQQGPSASAELAAHLRISAMAVRQHLYALQDEGLVSYVEEARAMGRPAKLWQLTAAADRFFPEAYAELILSLLGSVSQVFGPEGLERLLDQRTQGQILDYQAQLGSDLGPLAERVAALAAQRTQEGYMAEVETLPDGSFLLIENHCPICAAAQACTGLCDRELEVFRALLGSEVSVERAEHLLSGSRRCVYHISRNTSPEKI